MNIVRNAFEAQTQAYDHGERMRQDRARVTAGRQMQGGDLQGGAGTLYSAGDIKMGAGVQQMQQDQTDAATQAQAERAKAEKVRALEFAKRVSMALKDIPAPTGPDGRPDLTQRRQAYLERVGPALMQLGLANQQQMEESADHLDDQSLTAFGGEMDKHLQIVNRGNGAYDVVDTTTGNATRSVAPYPEYKEFDPTKNVMDVSGGGQPASGSAPNFDRFFSQYLAPAEGGYAANDGNGQPVNFGINQGSNPDIDVSKLTQDQAKQITLERYWKPSGADKLPAGLAEVQADTAFNMGLGAAQDLLAKSGGDVNRYIALREQKYRAIAQANPDKAKYLPTWLDRNQKLAQFVQGSGQSQGGGPRMVMAAQPKPVDTKKVLEEQNLQGQIDERAQKASDAETRKKTNALQAKAKAATVASAVDSALKKVSPMTTGLIGGNIGGIKGTEAYNLARDIETIKANLSFDELQKMRAASPTGGALGAVSDREIVLLSSTVASLDVGQSPEQLRANLKKVKQHYDAWLKSVTGEAAPPSSRAPAAARAAPPANAFAPAGSAGGVIRYDAQGNRM